jgi:hypothetical protein
MILRRRIRLLALLSLAAAACADRTLDSDAGGGPSTGGDVSSAPATGEDPQPTSGPGPTVPTTVDPPDPSTTGPAETSTSGPGPTSTDPTTPDPSLPTNATTPSTDSDPTATTVPFFDFGDPPAQVPDGIWQGCTQEAPPGTGIKGETAFGPFVSTRASFGYFEVNGQLGDVRLLFLDDAADAGLAFQELEQNFGHLTTGPAADITPAQQFTVNNPFWQGTQLQAAFKVIVKNQDTMVTADLEINGHAGNWNVNDPEDPARLLGVITPAPGQHFLAGSFDAVLCNSLSEHVIAE